MTCQRRCALRPSLALAFVCLALAFVLALRIAFALFILTSVLALAFDRATTWRGRLLEV